MVCGYGDCTGWDIQHFVKNLDECLSECSLDPSCKSIGSVTGENHAAGLMCMKKNYICDYTLETYIQSWGSVCLLGPALPHWLENHDTNRNEIIDNSNATYKIVISDSFLLC